MFVSRSLCREVERALIASGNWRREPRKDHTESGLGFWQDRGSALQRSLSDWADQSCGHCRQLHLPAGLALQADLFRCRRKPMPRFVVSDTRIREPSNPSPFATRLGKPNDQSDTSWPRSVNCVTLL